MRRNSERQKNSERARFHGDSAEEMNFPPASFPD
jgi:hypothetical protein